MSDTKDWLESLKVGDLVVSAGTALGLDHVDLVTSSGYSTAGGYSRTLLVEPTPARVDAIKARDLCERLRALLTRDAPFTLDQLTAAARALGLEVP